MAQSIIDRIPNHKTYAEVFGGAAWILFRKKPGSLEALNDLDRHLMNFYRMVKFHSPALVDEIAALQPSRDLFYMLRDEIDRPAMTDIQRAAAYYYIQRYAYAGRPGRPTIATGPTRPVRCRADTARKNLPLVAERLKSVMLENLPWERFIKLYDTPETFFFIDPPYLGHHEYRHNMKKDEFEILANTLLQIKGKFLLTHTDCPEIRALFAGLTIEEIEQPYTAHQMATGKQMRIGHEVLIRNF